MSEVPNDNSVQPTTLNNNEPKTLDHEHTLAGSSSLSASVTSLDNVSVASSKISKPSGIRPPSKIGRLCGNHHKPAIPTTPPKMAFGKADMSYYDSSDDSIRRITDGFGRHRLTDVLEDSEDGDLGGYLSSNNVTTRNRYSSFGSTTSSLDALWDLHPHRLSEAGLSRHSDSSNVLTEDTDSFIIGQRVWVSGNKPGHIAFIGETQFAPGEWAGIALDDAIGKNDGSVGGTRYFQCEPKKGVFSRLTRLTREPLEGASPVHTPSPVNNIRNSISPTGSTQGLMRSPVSMCGSNISLSSAASHVIDFKMGDRVIIKSSQGSKVGTVRYMGATEFAAGDWVGVELDDPRGKNDGSVNGKRYFECRPNFGLFAPITKVSKSPSKVKPGSCQIHGGAGLPPSGIRRANSKESLFSNMSTTSAASTARRVRLGIASLSPKKSPTKTTTTPLPTRTALQDVLKEKQRHIEQLLKEREEAEQKLTAVEQEYKKYRDEHNRKLEEDGKLLNTVKEINTQLTIHIEEERRKTEDIQFRLEETVICKDDLETKDKKSITKIEELEMQLIKEKQRNDSLEVDANKLFEAEENLIKFKEEIDTLKEQLQISRSKEIVLEGDHASTAVLIKSLQDEADRYKIDLSEKNNLINVLNQEISKTTSDLTKQLEESLTKYSDLEILSGKKDEDITDLRTKIHEANKSLEEKTARLADIANDKLTTETTLEKEIEKLKMELSAKIFDLDQFQEQLKGKESDSSNLNSELNSLRQLLKDREIEKEELSQQISAKNLQLEDITNKLELKQNEASEKEGNYIKLQNEFVTTNTELTKLKSELESLNREREVMLNSKDSEVLRLIENVKSKEEESVAHLSKYNLLKENHDNLLNQLEVSKVNADTLKKQYEENLNSKDSELKDYCDKTNKYENELAQQLAAYGELKVNYDNKITELQALQTETEGRKSQYEVELNEEKLTLKLLSEKLEGKENEIGNLKKECDTQNTKLSNVESELQRIREENEQMLNEANNKVKDLSNNVHEKEASILSLQTELQTTKIDLESVSNDLRQYQTNLNDVESNLKKERDDIKEQLKEKVKELEDSKSEFANIIAERDLKFQEISKELTNRIKEIENLESNIAKLNEENEVSNKKSVERHMQELAVKEERIQALTSQILEKGNEINTYKNTCSELTESIKQKDLELSKLQEGFLKDNTLSSETILKLNGEIENLSKANKEYQDTNNKLQILVQEKEQAYNDLNIEINKKTEETSVLMEQVNEKDQLIRSLQVDITAKEKELENALHDKQQSQTDKNESEITLRKEMDELRNGFSLKNQELDELKRVFSEKMSQNEIHLNEANDNVTKKSEELELLKQQFSQATIENEDKIKTIDEKYRKEFSDFEIRVSDLLTEIENKDGEIAKLTDLLSSNQDSSKERDGKLTSMAQELSSFSDQVQSQSQIIKKLEEDQSKIVQENERINKQLVDSNQHIQVLSEDKEKLNNELTDLSMSSGDASKKVSELNEIIREKERQHEADKVQNQIIMQKLENTIKELHTNNEVLEKSVHEHETKRKEDLKVRGELDKETQRVKVELSQKLVKVDELEKSLNAVTLTVAERDIQLSRQNSEIRKLKENNLSQGVSTNSKNDIKQLLEEKLFAENQVAFLNSIIADMQKKSEEQKARIEILEMGYNSSAADELTSLGFKFAKQTPPRMYCDICEEFDLHETEDCPTQGEDEDIPTHNQFSTDTKEKLPQRSYCDVCEVFGHATEDCTEDQEF